jgi:hypothetical protein
MARFADEPNPELFAGRKVKDGNDT